MDDPSTPTGRWNGADPHALLRREVGLLRARESRRVFDVSVNLGHLAGDRDSFVVRAQDLPVVDAALRTDVVAALLDDVPGDVDTVWLIRPGEPDPHDLDLEWLAASRLAFGMHDKVLAGFFAITRSGWLDVLTGHRRTWRRLRL
jgi:hypothetical protein